MTSRTIRQLVTQFVLTLVVVVAPAAAQNAAQNAADAERVLKALDLRPGSVVAELGAGDGELTVLIAKAVGDTGRVLSNEVNPERVQQIARTVERTGLKNVTVVTGQARDANLGEQCCDAVFMRDVYHHFADPEAMNGSIMKALKPGGKLVVLDFGPPPGAESPRPEDRDEDGHHGITPTTLERELKAAGFEVLSTEQYGFRSSLTVARRPMPPCPDDVAGSVTQKSAGSKDPALQHK
jgi:ubiquinone/menaquinone biosynthesis C-methylase UbiE